MHYFTLDEARFIKGIVFGRSHTEITALVNKKFGLQLGINQVKAFIKNHHLNTGRTGRFEKGHVPANKGTHCRVSPATEFKPGHRPSDYRPVGSERVDTDGYTWVKVSDPNKWRMKHVIIWEAANGPVPKGHVIIFGDRNRFNFELPNLLLITRSQLATLNHMGLIQSSAELTQTGILIANVLSAAHRAKKKDKGATPCSTTTDK